MRFIARCTHTEKNCPAGLVRPDKGFVVRADEHLKNSGVELVDAYTDGPGHVFTLVMETDDLSKVYEGLLPIWKIGEVDITQ